MSAHLAFTNVLPPYFSQIATPLHEIPLCNNRNNLLTNPPPLIYAVGMKQFLNASEIARLLDVDRATITRWIKKGLIKGAIKPDGTKQWRIPLSSYEEFIKKHYEGS